MDSKNSANVPEQLKTTPDSQRPAEAEENKADNVIPDEVPRKDGPGGEACNR